MIELNETLYAQTMACLTKLTPRSGCKFSFAVLSTANEKILLLSVLYASSEAGGEAIQSTSRICQIPCTYTSLSLKTNALSKIFFRNLE
jgi:hypothetical protein